MANQPRRTAIVAVHGVGDPGQGTTSKNIADLLLSLDMRAGRTSRYSAFAEQCICVPVRPMTGIHRIRESTPTSPFDDRGPYIRARHHGFHPWPEMPGDVGFMYDMMHDLYDGGPGANYKTARLSATRKDANGSDVQIDLYELYWADLVRLGNGALRVVGEFYQILLHLPSLGQRELDMARAVSPNRAWLLFDTVHDLAVRFLCLPLPILNLMILAITLVALPMWIPPAVKGYVAAGVLVLGGSTAIAALFFFYLPGLKLWKWLLVGALCVVGFALISIVLGCFRSDARFGACNLLGIEWVILASIGLGWIVSFYNKRRPGAREVALYGGVPVAVLAMILIGWLGNSVVEVFEAAFNIAQLLWYCLIGCWGAMLVLSFAAFICGCMVMVVSSGARMRAGRVAWTARLTLAISTALFFMTTILFWAAITAVGGGLLPGYIMYAPMDIGPHLLGRFLRLIGGVDLSPTEFRVYELAGTARYLVAASGTLTFAVVLVLLIVAVLLGCWALLPPVLGDIFPPRRPVLRAAAFGIWLNHGYRQLRTAGEIVFVATLLIGPVTYFRVPIAHNLQHYFSHSDFDASGLLWKLGTLIGAAVATLVVTGRLNSVASTVGPILTAILDVDAYMRVHPRSENPRGRIFTRYVALLRHICSAPQPYDQIIIVSHSQGTVITADLLRFLGEFGDPTLRPIGMAEGSKPALIPIHLMTMGCPLRQLYGKRFPNLYDWVVGEAGGDLIRPDPMSIGVWRWVNMYRTGDYVGRWLWRKHGQQTPDIADVVDIRADAWSSVLGPARAIGPLAGPGEPIQEICLGGGAHVRYFDINAPAVAYKIDELV